MELQFIVRKLVHFMLLNSFEIWFTFSMCFQRSHLLCFALSLLQMSLISFWYVNFARFIRLWNQVSCLPVTCTYHFPTPCECCHDLYGWHVESWNKYRLGNEILLRSLWGCLVRVTQTVIQWFESKITGFHKKILFGTSYLSSVWKTNSNLRWVLCQIWKQLMGCFGIQWLTQI